MIRLTFTYRNGTVNLIEQQQVEMKVPYSQTESSLEQQAEFWYEIRDSASSILFRLNTVDPTSANIEVFPTYAERDFQRITHPSNECVFTVVLPELENAEEVVLIRARNLDTQESNLLTSASAVEVGRFMLINE